MSRSLPGSPWGTEVVQTSEPTTRGLMSGRKVQTALRDTALGVSESNGCDKDTEPGTKDGWCGFPCE